MNENIGNVLRNRRKELGFSQKQVAEKLNVRYETIIRAEKCRNIGSKLLLDYIDMLGLEINIRTK